MAAGVWRGPGGIAGLHRLLTEHGEAIEADLLAFFHVDLLDLYRGRLTWRRLRVLLTAAVRRPDSALRLLLDTSGTAAWTLDQHLAAVVADRLEVLTYLTAKAHADPKKSRQIPEPEPIERPGVQRPPSRSGRIRFGGRHGSRELAQAR